MKSFVKDKLRMTIWLPVEAKEKWQQVKAQAHLADQTVGSWIWSLVKKELKP